MAKITPAPSAPTALYPIEAQGNLRSLSHSAPDSNCSNRKPTATSAWWQNLWRSVCAVLPRISELGYRMGTYSNQSSSVSSYFLGRSGCHLPLGSSSPPMKSWGTFCFPIYSGTPRWSFYMFFSAVTLSASQGKEPFDSSWYPQHLTMPSRQAHSTSSHLCQLSPDTFPDHTMTNGSPWYHLLLLLYFLYSLYHYIYLCCLLISLFPPH